MPGFLFFSINVYVYLQILGMIVLKNKLILSPVIFDIFFIAYSLFCLFRNSKIKITQCIFLLSILSYVTIFSYVYLISYTHILLLFTELKPLVYTVIIYIVITTDRNVHRSERLENQASVFFVGYIISITIQYIADVNIRGMRPFVLIENNFESIFVMVLMMKYLTLRYQLNTYAIGIGSISAAMSSIFLSTFYNRKFFILKMIIFPPVAVIIVAIFLFFREIEVSAVDRLFFIYATFQDLDQRELVGLMFGNLGSIELGVNDITCDKLLFYDVLKSGLCTPVQTHLYWSRIFLNFGIFGLAIVMYLLVSIAKITHFNFLLIGAVALNGFSVAGFASGIIALTLVLFLDRKKSYVPKGIQHH